MKRRSLFLTIPLCAVMSACGSSPAAPSSGGTGYDGQWSGTTSQGRSISFTVASQKVTAITIGYNFNGCSGEKTFPNLSLDIGNPPNPSPTLGPGFGFGSGNPEEPNYTQVYGNFSSTTAASGSAVFLGFTGCGNSGGFWTAARR